MKYTEFNFALSQRCPSIQGRNVGAHLFEWRKLMVDQLEEQGVVFGRATEALDCIRTFVRMHLSGPCRLEAEFSLQATKNVTDIDRMMSFITTCFRTDVTAEAAEIAEGHGTHPWFYYDNLALPHDMEIWQGEGRRLDGQAEDYTRFSMRRISERECYAHA